MIEAAEGHDHLLLGDQAGDGGHGCLPGHVPLPAQGIENPGKEPAEIRKQGQIAVLHRAEAAAGKAVALQEPQHNGAEQDDGGRPLYKVHAPLPGSPEHISGRGQMIGRKLHHKGRGLSRKGLEFLQNHAGGHHRPNAYEEGGYRNQGGIAEHRAGKQADDGHFRAAGNEARGHDGDLPVVLLLDGSGGQNAGHAAAGGNQHGNDGFAGQAEFAQEPVHNEGHPGHIAHILQQGQQEGQHQNLGHKAQHRAHTGQNAVHHQAVKPIAHMQRPKNRAQSIRNPLPEEHVVCPIGANGADGEGEAAHGDGIHTEHDQGKDGQSQHPIRHHPVDLVGQRQGVLGSLLLHGLADHGLNVGVPLVGNDGLRVVVHLPLAVPDVHFQVIQKRLGEVQLLAHHLVPLKELDGVPAQIVGLHLAFNRFLDMGQGVLHAAAEHMGTVAVGVILAQSQRRLGGLHAALALQRADFHAGAAQRLAQLFQIDGIAVFAHQIDHIHRQHHRMAQIHQLGGQVEIALNIRSVHDVQNHIRVILHQIPPGHQLLRRIGRQGINAGQILNDRLRVSLQGTLLLLHRHAGPVAHILIGAGQNVEQGGFSAIGIAGQGNFNLHRRFHTVPPLSVNFNHFRVSLPEAQLIAPDVDLHRIAQRGYLPDKNFHILGNSHVHDPTAHCPFSVELPHHQGLPDFSVLQCAHIPTPSAPMPLSGGFARKGVSCPDFFC